MSLRFFFKLMPAPAPVISLGGRFVRPRPIITVSVIGPQGTWVGDALLDSGADDSIFPEAVAVRAGIDLSAAPTGTAIGTGMARIALRFAEVSLRVTDGAEQRAWSALVGFTPDKLRRPLLGFAGFLQFFTATFHGDREEIELTVNSLYPGT